MSAMPAANDPTRPCTGQAGASANAVSGLPDMLLKASSEICRVLQGLRESRDALHQVTSERLQHTTAKLSEVSSATEQAATGILDGLDRSIAMVDELDSLDTSGEARAIELRGQLRDELFQAIGGLQFQDITAQQLSYASSILVGMERKLAELANALDPNAFGQLQAQPAAVIMQAFDQNATIHNAETRQALADSIFN